jgi:hypothetical protein
MQTMKVRTHVGGDGLLKLELPTSVTDRDMEVVVVMQPISDIPTDALGWPIGFFDRTYGALADDPLDEPVSLAWAKRDEVE